MKSHYEKHCCISHHSNNSQKSTKTTREEAQSIPLHVGMTNKQHNIDSNTTTQPINKMKCHTAYSCSGATMRVIQAISLCKTHKCMHGGSFYREQSQW